jgi:hypothetical protein
VLFDDRDERLGVAFGIIDRVVRVFGYPEVKPLTANASGIHLSEIGRNWA